MNDDCSPLGCEGYGREAIDGQRHSLATKIGVGNQLNGSDEKIGGK